MVEEPCNKGTVRYPDFDCRVNSTRRKDDDFYLQKVYFCPKFIEVERSRYITIKDYKAQHNSWMFSRIAQQGSFH